jgi:hypothetical protein
MYGEVAELVYAFALRANEETHGGSIPLFPTITINTIADIIVILVMAISIILCIFVILSSIEGIIK